MRMQDAALYLSRPEIHSIAGFKTPGFEQNLFPESQCEKYPRGTAEFTMHLPLMIRTWFFFSIKANEL